LTPLATPRSLVVSPFALGPWCRDRVAILRANKAVAMITVSKLFQQARMAFADGLWASPLGIGLLDRDLRFVDLNESLARMNGLSIEAHLGRTPMDLLPGVSVEIQEALRSVVRTGTPVVGHEFVIETPAMPGVRRVWLETYVPVRDAAGDAAPGDTRRSPGAARIGLAPDGLSACREPRTQAAAHDATRVAERASGSAQRGTPLPAGPARRCARGSPPRR
jgi:PAS domain-containing protein